MSIIKTNSKFYEPKTYDKVIIDLIHNTRWRQTIEKKIHNLEIYYTWEYKKSLESKKAIRYKWIFRIKYKSNKSVKRFKARLVAQRFF